jgi:non-heme chloroperoxidase
MIHKMYRRWRRRGDRQSLGPSPSMIGISQKEDVDILMIIPDFRRSEVQVHDGTTLRFIDEGEGLPLVMLPGLSGSAVKFARQVEDLRADYRVIALDPRGHGESDAPETGYNFHTLARDLHDVLQSLELGDIALLGHSAACKIILTYWELYDTSHVKRLILSDDAPCCVADGAFSFDEAVQLLAELESPDAAAHTKDLAAMFVSQEADTELRQFFYEQTLKMPRVAHAKLLRWALFGDWWDAVTKVDVPTLSIGGRSSRNPWQNMARIAEIIPGCELEIFEADEGGSHAMYWENPAKYNSILRQFLSGAWSA